MLWEAARGLLDAARCCEKLRNTTEMDVFQHHSIHLISFALSQLSILALFPPSHSLISRVFSHSSTAFFSPSFTPCCLPAAACRPASPECDGGAESTCPGSDNDILPLRGPKFLGNYLVLVS